MNIAKIIEINNHFVILKANIDIKTGKIYSSFVGEQIILSQGSKKSYAKIILVVAGKIFAQIIGDCSSFGIHSIAQMTGKYFFFPLSPTILGKKFDIFGNSIDETQDVLPLDIGIFCIKPMLYPKIDVEKIILSSLLSAGEVKQIRKISVYEGLNNLNIENICVVYVGYLDSLISGIMTKNSLDKVSVVIQIQNKNEWEIGLQMGNVVSKYLSIELGFDALLVVNTFGIDDNNSSDISSQDLQILGDYKDSFEQFETTDFIHKKNLGFCQTFSTAENSFSIAIF